MELFAYEHIQPRKNPSNVLLDKREETEQEVRWVDLMLLVYNSGAHIVSDQAAKGLELI